MFEIMTLDSKLEPVAGKADGKMGNKQDMVWVPVANIMNMDNDGLLEENKKVDTRTKPKTSFTADQCKAKWKLRQTAYKKAKTECDVSGMRCVGNGQRPRNEALQSRTTCQTCLLSF